jgi:hypothetical protein
MAISSICAVVAVVSLERDDEENESWKSERAGGGKLGRVVRVIARTVRLLMLSNRKQRCRRESKGRLSSSLDLLSILAPCFHLTLGRRATQYPPHLHSNLSDALIDSPAPVLPLPLPSSFSSFNLTSLSPSTTSDSCTASTEVLQAPLVSHTMSPSIFALSTGSRVSGDSSDVSGNRVCFSKHLEPLNVLTEFPTDSARSLNLPNPSPHFHLLFLRRPSFSFLLSLPCSRLKRSSTSHRPLHPAACRAAQRHLPSCLLSFFLLLSR